MGDIVVQSWTGVNETIHYPCLSQLPGQGFEGKVARHGSIRKVFLEHGPLRAR